MRVVEITIETVETALETVEAVTGEAVLAIVETAEAVTAEAVLAIVSELVIVTELAIVYELAIVSELVLSLCCCSCFIVFSLILSGSSRKSKKVPWSNLENSGVSLNCVAIRSALAFSRSFVFAQSRHG